MELIVSRVGEVISVTTQAMEYNKFSVIGTSGSMMKMGKISQNRICFVLMDFVNRKMSSVNGRDHCSF